MKQEPNAFCESSLFPTRAYSYSDNTQLYLRRLSKRKTGECAVLLAPQKTKQNNKTTRKTFGGYITGIMDPAPGATESESEQPPQTLSPDPRLKKKKWRRPRVPSRHAIGASPHSTLTLTLRIRVGGGNGNGDEDGDGAGAGAGVEASEQTQNGNGGTWTGTGREWERGWRPEDEHKIGTGTGTGAGTKTRAVEETGTGTGSETGKGTIIERERGEEE